MQYDQQPGGARVDLPKPSIDTGMGLERIAAVLQGVHDNYDTDTFKALIAASESLTGVKAAGEHAASRSEEHTSELQSLMRISYAVFCLKKKKTTNKRTKHNEKTQTSKQYIT